MQSMSEFLSANGWNYTVFLKCFAGPPDDNTELEAHVGKLLGAKVLVEDLGIVGEIELLAEITESLSFVGSNAEGVEPELIDSIEFRTHLSEVTDEVKHLVGVSDTVRRINIVEGHPAYPVFWDFSFLFKGGTHSTLFVGCSSD